MLRNGAVVWRGHVGEAKGGPVLSVRECFEEAWRRALHDGAVTDADAGQVQFRFSSS